MEPGIGSEGASSNPIPQANLAHGSQLAETMMNATITENSESPLIIDISHSTSAASCQIAFNIFFLTEVPVN